MTPILMQCYSFETNSFWCRLGCLCSHYFVMYLCSSLYNEFVLGSPVEAGFGDYLYSMGYLQVSNLVGCLLGYCFFLNWWVFFSMEYVNSSSVKYLSDVREFVNWIPRLKDVLLYIPLDDDSLSNAKSRFSVVRNRMLS